jgi:hypothetical protein
LLQLSDNEQWICQVHLKTHPVTGRKLLMVTLSEFILPFMIDKAIAQKMVLIMKKFIFG